ncbi:TPA: hypothetical protein N0F65_003891 [Lagenidium giganteum]|uniref:Uncharacterized protein n=1 Tax=Lagenidium giganteum TaxID=4803 RepID=A0AAV2ZA43_9STRA|nr:TPA: hypothetical protein N0F65_003891 [Lagenidium giganteum]
MLRAATTPRKTPDQNEHEYLRKHVDPVLMPLIESLLLYQPESIYEFIHDYVDEGKAGRFASNPPRAGYAKKLTNRRKMVDFMSTSVIPVMDDLAHQILREKPNSVKNFIREVVAARIIVGTSALFESNQLDEVVYKVGDRVLSRYKGRPRYFPGVITATEESGDLFTVRYDDGKTEQNVHRMCLKPAPSDDGAQARPRTARRQSGEAGVKVAEQPELETPRVPAQGLELVILIIGIDGAGKTTLLSTLQGDFEKEHVPSAGFTSATFQTETGSATFYDLGGGPAFRNVWKEYFADAHGILFVVDSSQENNVHQSAHLLATTMEHSMMKGKPLLIFANKNEHPSALSEQEVGQLMQISSYENAKVVPCVAKPSAFSNMVDERIELGLHWLFDQVQRNFDELNDRVQQDVGTKKREDAQRKAEQRARVSAWREERERNDMLKEDKASVKEVVEAAARAAKKAAEEPEEEVVIKCSDCTTNAAVTKCAASKWMPVCADCAARLKANA